MAPAAIGADPHATYRQTDADSAAASAAEAVAVPMRGKRFLTLEPACASALYEVQSSLRTSFHLDSTRGRWRWKLKPGSKLPVFNSARERLIFTDRVFWIGTMNRVGKP